LDPEVHRRSTGGFDGEEQSSGEQDSESHGGGAIPPKQTLSPTRALIRLPRGTNTT
jgi:hypothetical protein